MELNEQKKPKQKKKKEKTEFTPGNKTHKKGKNPPVVVTPEQTKGKKTGGRHHKGGRKVQGKEKRGCGSLEKKGHLTTSKSGQGGGTKKKSQKKKQILLPSFLGNKTKSANTKI